MAAKAGAHAVDGKRDGERATAKKAASKAVRQSPPDTYVDSMNGKRRPKYGKKGKLANGYYLQELTALQEELVNMGFCSDDQYQEFLRSCPQFQRMLIRSGIAVLKYWFSVGDEEQERRFQARAADPKRRFQARAADPKRRFQARAADPKRRWKLSPIDIESRDRWVDHSRAKDAMFEYTDTKDCPWHVVNADDKNRARLNCISHIAECIPYEDGLPPLIKLPKRAEQGGYIRPPLESQTFVAARF